MFTLLNAIIHSMSVVGACVCVCGYDVQRMYYVMERHKNSQKWRKDFDEILWICERPENFFFAPVFSSSSSS